MHQSHSKPRNEIISAELGYICLVKYWRHPVVNVGRLSELGFEGFRPNSRFGGGLEATMQFAVQASMQGIRVLPNPGIHLRRHVTASASPQLGAL